MCSCIILNLDVVQYEAKMLLLDDFYRGLNGSEPIEAIKQFIINSNNYLSGSKISDTILFFIEILHTEQLRYNYIWNEC